MAGSGETESAFKHAYVVDNRVRLTFSTGAHNPPAFTDMLTRHMTDYVKRFRMSMIPEARRIESQSSQIFDAGANASQSSKQHNRQSVPYHEMDISAFDNEVRSPSDNELDPSISPPNDPFLDD